MTLPAGTALHHGNYVVDAFSAEDAIGPIYLATHIPSGRWVQLRILGSRHPELIPFPEVRKNFYNYLLMVQALNHPLFSGHLSGFEDSGVCYQVMDADLGHPLGRFVSPSEPVPLRQGVALVRQVAQGLLALKPLGWQGITLTPDQLWQNSNQTTLTFTGFNFPPSEPILADRQEARLVKGLSYLLYFVLTGKRAENTRAPLAVDVRHQLPDMPYDLDTALQLGSHQNMEQPSMSLQQWLELLPSVEGLTDKLDSPQQTEGAFPGSGQSQGQRSADRPPTPVTGAATVIAAPARVAATEMVAPHPAPSHRSKQNLVAPVALVLTSLIASLSGLSVGLSARLQPTSSSNPVRLNPEQSFPPLSDWGGNDPVDAWDYSPGRRSLPDYGNAPPQPAVVVPDRTSLPGATVLEKKTIAPDDDFNADGDFEFGSPTTRDDTFFEDADPFTATPEPAALPESFEKNPSEGTAPAPVEQRPEPPAAIPSLPEAIAPPPTVAPKPPAPPPAPLTSPPPSAPAPASTS